MQEPGISTCEAPSIFNQRLESAALLPHSELHGVSSHGVQVQNIGKEQLAVHVSTCLLAFISQTLPHAEGIVSIERRRQRCPLHLEQSPHKDQAPQTQSVHISCEHAWVPHGRTTLNSLGQAPPLRGSVLQLLLLSCCPPPHVLEHLAQSLQGFISQFCGGDE